MFRHILDNLFSNAVEYTSGEGQIAVIVNASGVDVANSVNGFPKENVENLFHRFWRVDAARSESSHAGLGLSIAKTCAEALGLQLTAKLENSVLRMSLTQGA